MPVDHVRRRAVDDPVATRTTALDPIKAVKP